MTKKNKVFNLELPDNITKDQLESLLEEVKERIKTASISTDIYITCVLDISGSMESMRDDAIGGFNVFLKEQQDSKDGQAFLTLHLFDDKYETVFSNTPIAFVKPLTRDTFVPRGSTSLTDALGKTMTRLLNEKNTNNIIVILTDGGENSSKEFTMEGVKKLITKCEELNYQFIYLGANQDAFSVSSGYGMTKSYTSNFVATGAGIRSSYSTASSFSSTTRSNMVKGSDSTHTKVNQKKAS